MEIRSRQFKNILAAPTIGAFAGIVLVGVSLAAPATCAAAEVVIRTAPPNPIVETVPPPPGRYYVWDPGHWRWNGNRYVWVRGHYVHNPHHGGAWVPGHWVSRPGGWVWIEGHWR
jgi:WXXGXW repeat (2 copies)